MSDQVDYGPHGRQKVLEEIPVIDEAGYRGARMAVAISALVAASVASVVALFTDSSLTGILSFIGVLALAGTVHIAYFRGIASAFCLFLIPPGVIGESSSMFALVGAAGLLVIVMTYRDAPASPSVGLRIFAVLAMVCPAVGLIYLNAASLAVVQGILTIVAILSASQRRFLKDLTTGLIILFALYVTSYLVTLAVGFSGNQLTTLKFGTRNLELYFPITLATSGPPILEETRRGSPLLGEPGLVVFYLLPMLAALFVLRRATSWWAIFVLVTLVSLLTQSTATILVVVVVLLIGLTLTRIRRRSLLSVALVMAIGVLLLPVFILPVFAQKGADSGISLADRGIGSNSGYANINIMTAMENDPLLAACLITGIIFAATIALRSIPGTVIWLAFTITAVVAQPSQWQVGAWFVLVAFSLSFGTPSRPAAPRFSHHGATERAFNSRRLPLIKIDR
ncbi:hypothetical protein LTH96_03980 [Nesterenkonia sp. LB17]|uniref:hypothetical protein n=1 Tax=Nesterenkonia sp. LB17 TaxID=2901230 RepID=UPI001F4C8D37|nr:hypothetical protein [Nesterenkonia sp. LB17]MCH8564896.1 hypothetical protein [Nesterenkonia sp. LB17]